MRGSFKPYTSYIGGSDMNEKDLWVPAKFKHSTHMSKA